MISDPEKLDLEKLRSESDREAVGEIYRWSHTDTAMRASPQTLWLIIGILTGRLLK